MSWCLGTYISSPNSHFKFGMLVHKKSSGAKNVLRRMLITGGQNGVKKQDFTRMTSCQMACKVVQRCADFHLICFNGHQKGFVASCVMKIGAAVLEIDEPWFAARCAK